MSGGILSINLAARLIPSPLDGAQQSGIAKHPLNGPVRVDVLGLVGDHIGNTAYHGGPDKAIYAYAKEDLRKWERLLGRELPNGTFGENLTTVDLDVSGALIGEQWEIRGSDRRVLLEVTQPRTPCGTFKVWMGERMWGRKFERSRAPGAYLRILAPGEIAPGDEIHITWRPGHGIAVRDCGLLTTADTMSRLLDSGQPLADALAERAERIIANVPATAAYTEKITSNPQGIHATLLMGKEDKSIDR